MKRRDMLKSLLAFSVVGTTLPLEESQAAAPYPRTPRDSEGPFYPVAQQADEDSNLVQVQGKAGQASGSILNLSGVVRHRNGQPIAGAEVDIWQADSNGQYHHPDDARSFPLDPHFQYWGKATTQADGTYYFKTLIPGHYSGRPPHIHYKVWVAGRVRLTSQIYFKNHPQNHLSGFNPANAPLQTVEIEPLKHQEFGSFFQIVI